jgi:hypothetical protein
MNKTEKIFKPWGEEIIWALTDKYVGKILHINEGHKLSLQYHRIKEPLTIHRFAATQGTDVKLMEVSTTELNDIVRIEDDYSRK